MTPDRLTFTRESERRTSDEKLRDQLDFIALRALAGSRGRGWAYQIGPIGASQPFGTSWLFSAWIRFYRTREIDAAKEHEQRLEIYSWAAATGHNARFANHPWIAEGVKEKEVEKEIEKQPEITKVEETPLPSSPPDPLSDDEELIPLSSLSRIKQGDFYSHLFGRDAQVRILLSSIQAACDSKMQNRFHSLLYGSPGCGKTDILLSTAKLLAEQRVSYLIIDATTSTGAGIRKALLDEDAILPDVIIVEEIEKVSKEAMHPLLGIMDERGTISQFNSRRTASRKVPALILASANDYELLAKTESGALLSRFSNEIYCPRPDREILSKILQREIEKVKGGDLAWIEPTLKFCYDERKITDPRMLKRICLCGKERLISGEYQRDLQATMRVETPQTSKKPPVDLSAFGEE